jgi:hypothetical protein
MTIISAANCLTCREARWIRNLPVRPRAAADLDLQVYVLAVVEQAPPSGPAATIAPENLVERFLDGQVPLEEQALSGPKPTPLRFLFRRLS